jgi:hypothetical protein
MTDSGNSFVSAGAGETIRLGGIEISASGIKPVVGNLATLCRREEIREVIVQYGFRSHHPLLQVLFGAGLSLLLVPASGLLLRAFGQNGTLEWGACMLSIPGVLGLWLVIDAGSRGYFVRVVTKRERR